MKERSFKILNLCNPQNRGEKQKHLKYVKKRIMSIAFAVQSFGGTTGLKNDNGYVCRRERDTFLNGTSQYCTLKRRNDRHFVVCTAIQSASLDSSMFIIDEPGENKQRT